MANFLVSLCVIIFRSYSFSLLTTKLRWNFLECQCSRIDAFGGEALRWIYLVKYLKSLRIIDLWLPLKKIFHNLACFIAISTRMISCYFLECAIFGFFVTDELGNGVIVEYQCFHYLHLLLSVCLFSLVPIRLRIKLILKVIIDCNLL